MPLYGGILLVTHPLTSLNPMPRLFATSFAIGVTAIVVCAFFPSTPIWVKVGAIPLYMVGSLGISRHLSQ